MKNIMKYMLVALTVYTLLLKLELSVTGSTASYAIQQGLEQLTLLQEKVLVLLTNLHISVRRVRHGMSWNYAKT